MTILINILIVLCNGTDRLGNETRYRDIAIFLLTVSEVRCVHILSEIALLKHFTRI